MHDALPTPAQRIYIPGNERASQCFSRSLFLSMLQPGAGCRAYDNLKFSGNAPGLPGAAPASCVLEVSNITNIALAFGFSIFVLVYATAAYTGILCRSHVPGPCVAVHGACLTMLHAGFTHTTAADTLPSSAHSNGLDLMDLAARLRNESAKGPSIQAC